MKEKYMREGKRESKQGCEKDFLLSSHGFSFLFLWAQIMRKCGLWDSQKYNQRLDVTKAKLVGQFLLKQSHPIPLCNRRMMYSR